MRNGSAGENSKEKDRHVADGHEGDTAEDKVSHCSIGSEDPIVEEEEAQFHRWGQKKVHILSDREVLRS